MASLTIDKLNKTYGPLTVVDNISLEVADGEFLVLVGPSGCGKSTTLRMIAGLEGIDGGSIRIADKVVNDTHPADRDVAMVFQSYALYPHMSVLDNISYGLRRRGLPRAEITERVNEVAAKLRLDALLSRRPAQLSGGQRQRVALGRAIVRKPAVFLMDEPLSNLDAKLRVEMRAELARLHSDLGVTTVYVTHDQVEAMTMGDRIVVMNAGRIEQIGTPLDVYRHPASLFVARFLGLPEINLLTGKLTANGVGSTFTAGGIAVPFAQPLGPDAGELQLGLRPQDLFGSTEPHPPDAATLGEAVTVTVEHHGPESFAACRLAGTMLTVRILPSAAVRPGTPLFVAVDAKSPHFFSSATGQRVDPFAAGAA